MKGASSAILVLLLTGAVIAYLMLDKMGYERPAATPEAAGETESDPEFTPEAEESIVEQAGEGTHSTNGLPLPPTVDPAQPGPVATPSAPAPDPAPPEAGGQTLEQERQRLAEWQEDLEQRAVWIQQAEQNLLAMQGELVERLGELHESIARAESQRAEARVQELALQQEREQVRREKERLGWLQIGLLALIDLILIIEIARLRRPVLDWLRSRQSRPARPARKPTALGSGEIRPA